jgi:hypothetical protein
MEYRPTEHPLSWFKDRYMGGELVIQPPYQRKAIWSAKQKCYLVETILMGFPVPEIYLQHTTTPAGESTYTVVDGQQRIRAALQFVGAETDTNEAAHNEFTLDRLPSTSKWKDATFGRLPDETKKKFYSYIFAVRYIETDDSKEIIDIFERLNKYLSPLKPQELRNAKYSGPFIVLAEKLADDDYWATQRIVSPAVIRRMGDVEFVSELIIGVMHGPQSGSAAEIDDYYAKYEDFDYEFPGQRRAHALFNSTLDLVRRIYPDLSEAPRWGNRTDFYTLFVALSTQAHTRRPTNKEIKVLREALNSLALCVDRKMKDQRAKVDDRTVAYVKSVEKGANDRARRAARHGVVVEVIGDCLGRDAREDELL